MKVSLLHTSLLALFTASIPFQTSAQPSSSSAADVEQLLQYAQCIRENGYPEFPDPSLDGRLQIRLELGSAAKFQAAQQACRDKVPSGMSTLNQQEMTPERMEMLIGFSRCMRDNGVGEFPDPNSQGAFEIVSSSLDIRSAQVQGAMQTCRESNPVSGLMIRMAQGQ